MTNKKRVLKSDGETIKVGNTTYKIDNSNRRLSPGTFVRVSDKNPSSKRDR